MPVTKRCSKQRGLRNKEVYVNGFCSQLESVRNKDLGVHNKAVKIMKIN